MSNEIKVSINKIKYNLDGILGFDSYVEEGTTKEGILSELPDSGCIFWGGGDETDLISLIQKNLEDNFGWMVIGFDYEFEGKTKRYDEFPINQTLSSSTIEDIKNGFGL